MLKLATACIGLARTRQPAASQLLRLFSDSGINTEDSTVLKKFVGLTDNLGSYHDPRATFTALLQQLQESIKSVPETSGYRQAVEGTVQYRLKVLEENETNQAVEEVLDAHLEELIVECKDELKLLPEMTSMPPHTPHPTVTC
jgi:NADH dehydrogenase (ubiquinone) 1 alpha subcomplex subunit 5